MDWTRSAAAAHCTADTKGRDNKTNSSANTNNTPYIYNAENDFICTNSKFGCVENVLQQLEFDCRKMTVPVRGTIDLSFGAID